MQKFVANLFDEVKRRKNFGKKDHKNRFYFYVYWGKYLSGVDTGGKNAELIYPGPVLKFSRCICLQDVADEIRDAAFKDFKDFAESKLPTL